METPDLVGVGWEHRKWGRATNEGARGDTAACGMALQYLSCSGSQRQTSKCALSDAAALPGDITQQRCCGILQQAYCWTLWGAG